MRASLRIDSKKGFPSAFLSLCVLTFLSAVLVCTSQRLLPRRTISLPVCWEPTSSGPTCMLRGRLQSIVLPASSLGLQSHLRWSRTPPVLYTYMPHVSWDGSNSSIFSWVASMWCVACKRSPSAVHAISQTKTALLHTKYFRSGYCHQITGGDYGHWMAID